MNAAEEAANARSSAGLCLALLISLLFWTVVIVVFVPFGPVIATLGPGHGVHLGDLALLPAVAWFGWCRSRWLARVEWFESLLEASR